MPHLLVIGGGIIGLASALTAQRRGWCVTLVDRDFEGDRASHGNAGGIAVSEALPFRLEGLGMKPLRWLVDPLGPLAIRPVHAMRMLPWLMALRRVSEQSTYLAIAHALGALNERALKDFEMLLAAIGASDELHKFGALTVYESMEAFRRDAKEWDDKRSLGVRWRTVEAPELRVLEPNLAPVFARAVMLEDWAHIDDPKRIVDGLRASVRQGGAELVTGEVSRLMNTLERPAAALADGRLLEADRVLIAAGAWSGHLALTIGDRVLLESERGYNTTLPLCVGLLQREVIFAERKFVATPLGVGLRVGGAAEFAGLRAPANFRRSNALLQLARRYLPDLDERGAERWMGHRPATPDSLPVIGPSPRNRRILYAFGHGHLGLTQSATTAELIGHLLDHETPPIDMSAYSIRRFS